MFYKIYKTKVINAFLKLIPEKTYTYATRNADNIPFVNIRHSVFQNYRSCLQKALNGKN